MLYRALGVEAQVEVETQSQPLEDGDIFLLCSDGLTRYVDGEELANVVLAATAPDQACERLVSLTNERGGRDNCSIVIAKIESQGSSPSSSSSSSSSS
jgi:protein phosphatase